MHGDVQIGPFSIQSKLGEGGMGCVYEGVHVSSGERYAVKTARATSPLLRNHLRTELRALNGLRHPYVVRVRMSGIDEETPWYAMDLLRGVTLRGYIGTSRAALTSSSASVAETACVERTVSMTKAAPENGRAPDINAAITPSGFMDIEWTCRFFQHLCDALDYLHSQGIVHADIKPENIFVTNDGLPVLVDLGISSVYYRSSRDDLETTDRTVGTIVYSPLEQINGELLDPRADLYALGCTLYECLTGTHPYRRHSRTETLAAKRENTPPSAAVYRRDLPAALDVLLKRLLARDPRHRIGHAVDVAAVLHRFAPIPTPVRHGSGAVSNYLYRPPLIGRKELLRQLNHYMENTADGTGSGVVLRGESGIGKTRLISEVSKLARQKDITVIGLSCAEGNKPEQLAPYRTARGTIQFLLSKIEELGLSQVRLWTEEDMPDDEQDDEPIVVSKSSRAALLVNAKASLLDVSAKSPLMLVIDDFQWADDLLIQLVSELASCFLSQNRIFIVAAVRTEPFVRDHCPFSISGLMDLHLDPLSDDEVCRQVQSMLAMDHPPPGLLSYMCEMSGGIPLLVVEHLRAAVDAGVLQRDRLKGWTFRLSRKLEFQSKIPVSETLKKLIASRLSHLGIETQSVVQAAAVLGREFDVAELEQLFSGNISSPVQQLRHREIVAFRGEHHFRFTHARLHEHIYNSIPEGERFALHKKAVALIEDLGIPQTRAAEFAYHLDRAGEPDRAAQYYEIAARAAVKNQQYGFAETALESALGNLDRVKDDKSQGKAAKMRLGEALGDVAMVLRHQEKAEAAYRQVAALSQDDPLRLARQHRNLAAVFQANREVSLSHLRTALKYLADGEECPARRTEWMQTNIQCLWAHYWGNEPEALLKLAEEIETVVDAHGDETQRGELNLMIALGAMQSKRYVTGENEIRRARLAVDYLKGGHDSQLALHARFILSLISLFADRLDTAREGFEETVAESRAASNVTLQLRGMMYLSVLHRRRRDIEQTRQTATAVLTLADSNGMAEYSATARANLAWIAYQEGDFEAAERLSMEALKHWKESTIVYPFWWTALFPLLAVLQHDGRISETKWIAEKLLDVRQQALPVPLTLSIQRLSDAHRAEPERCSDALEEVLTVARQHDCI